MSPEMITSRALVTRRTRRIDAPHPGITSPEAPF
jgi:hypothetical protein